MARRSLPVAQELITEACAKYREQPFGTLGGETITYGEVWERGGRLASGLFDQGLETGDRVGILMANRLEYFVANMACVRGGFVNVPVNAMLTQEEYRYIFEDSGVRAIVAGPHFVDLAKDVGANLPDFEFVVAINGGRDDGTLRYASMISDSPPLGPNAAVSPIDPLRLSYTGGTTGNPKGTVHTHGGLGASMVALTIDAEIRAGEEMLLMTPLSHASGYYHLAGMTRGAHFTLMNGFDVAEFFQTVKEFPITWTFLVPTMLYRVLDSDELRGADVSSLDTVIYAAAPIAPHRVREAIQTFGPVFIQLYGQTETAAVGTSLPKYRHTGRNEKTDTVGQAGALTKIRVVDQTDETTTDPLPAGEVGEILIRGPFTLERYYELPRETEATIVEGWVRTGDIGCVDDEGFVTLLDRKHDVIISGGMNVYSTEVEEVLERHDRVNAAAVIGIPHEDWGEAVHAVVALDDADVTEDDIHAFVDEHLAAYKKPKSVEIVDELPTTSYGKIDKTALRKPYWENQERQIH